MTLRRNLGLVLVVVALALLLLSTFGDSRQLSKSVKPSPHKKHSIDIQYRTSRGAHPPSRLKQKNKSVKLLKVKGKDHRRRHHHQHVGQDKRRSEKKSLHLRKGDGRQDRSNQRSFTAQRLEAGILCGPDNNVGACPQLAPCCSKWGYCGIGTEYCGEGCQIAFGQCGAYIDTEDDKKEMPITASSETSKYRSASKITGHDFDIYERRQMLKDYNGKQFRIPSTVPKLPVNNTLVNIAYFPGWTQHRGRGETHCHQRPYLPKSIPWSSLDYVMFAFVYFDKKHKLYPSEPDEERLYLKVNELKMATGTRVMISVGGWSFTHPESKDDEDTSQRFAEMIRTRKSRKSFITSCIEFCQLYGFDGVDIDYEYPAYKDRHYVTALFKEMRQAFDAEGSGLVLSMAGASFQDGIQGFELDKVASYLDFIMVMSYVQMPTENHSGHSVQGAVELYLDRGVPREKIVLGLALYGKTFILKDVHQTEPGVAHYKSGGDPTSCIETRGDIAYNEIANLIHPKAAAHGAKAIKPRWDPHSKTFYFVYGERRDNWVGYDDRPSLDLKLQLVTELNLAGVMWWSLDQDLDAASIEGDTALFKSYSSVLGRRAIPAIPFLQPFESKQGVGNDKNVTLEDAIQLSALPAINKSTAASPISLLNPVLQDSASTRAAEVTDASESVLSHARDRCPVIAQPPEWMTTILLDELGQPGLVPYVAAKRKRCSVSIELSHILPETPVGNSVFKKCSAPENCPESWQAFTCELSGWSVGSPCYDKATLSPSLYFFGELELVRATARDRDVQDMSATKLEGDESSHSLSSSSRVSNRLREEIGQTRPRYISQYLKSSKMQGLIVKARKAKKANKAKKSRGKKVYGTKS
ncbi:hypothetical protein EDD11_006066 [Mortierella claussenii]|nr:hypothetical protein EDD11_006066 [Mortierella claussenii]